MKLIRLGSSADDRGVATAGHGENPVGMFAVAEVKCRDALFK